MSGKNRANLPGFKGFIRAFLYPDGSYLENEWNTFGEYVKALRMNLKLFGCCMFSFAFSSAR